MAPLLGFPSRARARYHRASFLNHVRFLLDNLWLFRRMTDRLDAMTVRVENEGGVVGGMVLRAESRRPIIPASSISAATWKASTAGRSAARQQRCAPGDGVT